MKNAFQHIAITSSNLSLDLDKVFVRDLGEDGIVGQATRSFTFFLSTYQSLKP